MLHTSTRTHAGKLFAICNALQFDNLGQMSDKTKQFAKYDKFCQPGGPLDTSINVALRSRGDGDVELSEVHCCNCQLSEWIPVRFIYPLHCNTFAAR